MANLNLSEFTEKLFVADADHTFIWDTAASISKRVSRNSWLNSGTLTSDAPVTISQTWNAGSNVMTALKVVATDTASGATSNLLELWAGSTPALDFAVTKAGAMQSYGTYSSSGANYARLALACDSSGNATISTQALGTGTAGVLAFSPGNSERMRITTAGNVGIGTTNPTTPLSIQASSVGNVLNVIGVGSFGNFLFQVGGIYGVNLLSQGNTSTDGFILGTDGGASNAGAMLRLQTKGSTRAVIDYLGNVGIGTTAPGANLHIRNDQGAFTGIYVDNRSVAVGSYSGIALGTNITGAHQWFLTRENTLTARLDIALNLGSPFLSILSAGNVGIGTTSPTSKLQVTNGDVEIETVTSGIIMKAAGTANRYRITLNAGGTDFVITAL